VVMCLGQGADLHMAQLMPVPLTICCSSKSRLVLPSWFYLSGERDSEGQWHQLGGLGHMQICTSPQTDIHARIPPLSFLQARCPSCRPSNSVKANKFVIIEEVEDDDDDDEEIHIHTQ